MDSSRTLVDEARRRASGLLNVEFHVADAASLPFADRSFDAVRTERTLQHLSDPAAAVAEMARVAKTGGRVAAFEPDWSTLRIETGPPEVAEAVCRRWRAGILQPQIGRRLVQLFDAAGLVVERAEEQTVTIDELSFAERQFELSRLAAAEGAADWFAELRRLDAAGRFRAWTTYVSVLARH